MNVVYRADDDLSVKCYSNLICDWSKSPPDTSFSVAFHDENARGFAAVWSSVILDNVDYCDAVGFLVDDTIIGTNGLDPYSSDVKYESPEPQETTPCPSPSGIPPSPKPQTIFTLFASLLPSLRSGEITAIQPRLSPSVSWSHTQDRVAAVPKTGVVWDGERGCYLRSARLGDGVDDKGEWEYYFDLCGGVYSTDVVREILGEIMKRDSKWGPNEFEAWGNAYLRSHLHNSKDGIVIQAFPPASHLCVPTVNVVQTKWTTPVYGDTHSSELTVGSLLRRYDEERKGGGVSFLDSSAYGRILRCGGYDSVHVGEFVTISPSSCNDEDSEEKDGTSYCCSVLLPIGPRNPPGAIKQCLLSVISQSHPPLVPSSKEGGKMPGWWRRLYSPFPIEITIVDDGNTDGTIEEARSILEDAENDGRNDLTTWKIIPSSSSSSSSSSPSKSSPKPKPLGPVLNFGISCCSYPYIARIDADDVMAPGRLRRQMEFFRWEEGGGRRTEDWTDVLGMGSVKFADAPPSRSSGTVIPPHSQCFSLSIPPASWVLTDWGGCFTCLVSHPSVLIRRSSIDRVIAVQGRFYNEELAKGEDHELWTRLRVRNLGGVGVWHRKHFGNRSRDDERVEEEGGVSETIGLTHSILLRRYPALSSISPRILAAIVRPDVYLGSYELFDLAPKGLMDVFRTWREGLFGGGGGSQERSLSETERREISLVSFDVRERMGSFCAVAYERGLNNDVVVGSVAWRVWKEGVDGNGGGDWVKMLGVVIGGKRRGGGEKEIIQMNGDGEDSCLQEEGSVNGGVGGGDGVVGDGDEFDAVDNDEDGEYDPNDEVE